MRRADLRHGAFVFRTEEAAAVDHEIGVLCRSILPGMVAVERAGHFHDGLGIFRQHLPVRTRLAHVNAATGCSWPVQQ